ncbi:MAG: mucoidy inhibitor MuiA family protein [Polyangia bacterium]
MALVSLATLCALSQAISVDAPVSAVTVYSDRARVVRSAKVGGSGARRVEIVVPQRADPASIRVQADGAQVTRVEIARLDEAQFPADEARKLLAGLETLDDKLARNRAEHDAWAAQLEAARSLKPRLPEPEGTKPRPKLNPAGWLQVTAWSRTWMEKAQAELRRLDDAQRAMLKQRGPLVEKARLLGGAERRTGWRVVPTLEGGEAKLRVSYEISGARWYPSYDIQLHPEIGRVEIHFAGEVSQETGEDWSDAALTLSTAVPAESVTTVARGRHRITFGASAPAAPEPTEQIGLLPPPGWHAPTWDAWSPTMLWR